MPTEVLRYEDPRGATNFLVISIQDLPPPLQICLISNGGGKDGVSFCYHTVNFNQSLNRVTPEPKMKHF